MWDHRAVRLWMFYICIYQCFGCWCACTSIHFMDLCRSWYAKTPKDSLECIAVNAPDRRKHLRTYWNTETMAWHGMPTWAKTTEVAKVLNSQVMWHFGRMKPATVAVVLWTQTEGRSLAAVVQSSGVTSPDKKSTQENCTFCLQNAPRCNPSYKGNIAKKYLPNERQLDSIPWNFPCCAAQFCTHLCGMVEMVWSDGLTLRIKENPNGNKEKTLNPYA